MNYFACAFIPKNKGDLRSYRKLPGEDKLEVIESLPLVINIFIPHDEADVVDEWLDSVIDSEAHLQGYVELMQRKKKGSPSVQILKCLVSWYASSKDDVSSSLSTNPTPLLAMAISTNIALLALEARGWYPTSRTQAPVDNNASHPRA